MDVELEKKRVREPCLSLLPGAHQKRFLKECWHAWNVYRLFGPLNGGDYLCEPLESGGLLCGCLTQVKMSLMAFPKAVRPERRLTYGPRWPQRVPQEARDKFLEELRNDPRIPDSQYALSVDQLDAFGEWQQRFEDLCTASPA